MKLYAVNRKRWQNLTLFEQMGNIGSEVGRTFHAKQRGERYQEAMARALDLFDATVAAKGRTSAQLKEILRAKEEYLSAIENQNKQPAVEKYFMDFAIAARLNK